MVKVCNKSLHWWNILQNATVALNTEYHSLVQEKHTTTSKKVWSKQHFSRFLVSNTRCKRLQWDNSIKLILFAGVPWIKSDGSNHLGSGVIKFTRQPRRQPHCLNAAKTNQTGHCQEIISTSARPTAQKCGWWNYHPCFNNLVLCALLYKWQPRCIITLLMLFKYF